MNSITKDIIFLYLGGQATVIQKRMIQEWLLAPENTETYYEWLEEWEVQHTQFQPDVNTAMFSFKDKMSHESTAPLVYQPDITITPVAVPRGRFLLSYAAAATVLAAVVGGYFFFRQQDSSQHYRTLAGETRTLTLNDSTVITLGPGSDLQLSKNFGNEKERNVRLNGQAIFSVKHTFDNRPFFVNTPSGLQVAVLGTEFDLLATKDSNRIYLSKGSVKLYLQEERKDSIKMQPGDLIKVNSKKNVQIKTAQLYWQMNALQNHAIIFNKNSLADISLIMKEQFGKIVTISDSALAARTVSGSYKWTSVEEFMLTLSEMMNFQLIKNGDEYIVK